MKVVFCGTPNFSLPLLEFLHHHPLIEIISCITMPDRAAHRGKNITSPAVATFAKSNKIPLWQTANINNDDEFLTQLESKNIDMFIVLAFAQFLGKRVLNLPQYGCFNVHTSKLPKYRGAAPIQYAIMNGDRETGVTIQRMVKKMDAGDIVGSSTLKINDYDNGSSLATKLKFLCVNTMTKFLDNLLDGNIEYISQDENEASFAPTIKKEDGFLNFKLEGALDISNRVRALTLGPNTYCYLADKRLKVLRVRIDEVKLTPGEVNTQFETLLVGTKSGTLRLIEVCLEGKKVCSDVNLLNGFRQEIVINKDIL